MDENRHPFESFDEAHKDDDQFIEELEALLSEEEPTPGEADAPATEKQKPQRPANSKKKGKKILFYGLLCIFSAVFLFSVVYLAQYLIRQARDEGNYDKLSGIVESIQNRPTEPPATGDPYADPTEPQILPEYLPLYEMNSDMVGWIKLEGTNINYPVMQTPDSPDYYLDKNFNKQTSKAGAIYVREACDVFKPSDNVVIYGHFISSGQQMFTHLHKYIRKAFWQDNQYITFDTLYEHHTYQVFAVFKTSANPGEGYAYHRFNDALDKEDFDSYIQTVKNMSFYNTGITPQYGDKLITLSTCEYTQENGRLVVVAVQVS